MTFRRADLFHIVSRARTITDRLGVASPATSPLSTPADESRRFARWQTVVASGDDSAFTRYLDWNGWTIESAHAALSAPPMQEHEPLPAWTTWLSAGIAEADALAAERAPLDTLRRDRALRAGAPFSFEECLLPFVRVARRRLAASLPSAAPLDDTAIASLERELLELLSVVCEQTLFAEWSLYRARADMAIQAATSALFGGRPVYDGFITGLLTGGLQHLLLRYPALARLIGVRLDFWLDGSLELVDRLIADAQPLGAMFGAGVPLGNVVEINGGLSDPHCDGRRVAILRFASGTSVVYKPRSALLECEWSALLTTLNASFADLPLRALRHLPLAHHVWVEMAHAESCVTTAQVDRFYERGGMLLCLAYLLGGADLHQENVIACGEHPVLVDLEALLVPQLDKVTIDNQRPVTSRVEGTAIWESVLRTGLLPTLHVGPGGVMEFVGGFVHARSVGAAHIPVMERVNTDAMRPAMGGGATTASNVPTAGTDAFDSARHAPAIARGFQRMYGVILARRTDLLAEGGALSRFAGLRARVLLRDTGAYGTVLRRALHPRFLTDGADFGIEIEVMRYVKSTELRRPAHWCARVAEVEQIAVGDVPIFWAATDGVDVESQAGTCIVHAVGETAYDAARARIAAMCDEDLESQLNFIRISMRAVDVKLQRSLARVPGAGATQQASLNTAAIDIADAVLDTAIDGDGGIGWVGLMHQTTKSSRLVPLGWSLYDGRCGVALFFAAVARLTGESRYRDAARGAFNPLLIILADAAGRGRLADEMGIGGGTGMGGVAYALARAAHWLNDAELMDGALNAALAVTTRRIERDHTFDLVGGAAGAALGLLAVHEVSSSAAVLTRARACGDWLARHQQLRGGHDGRGWRVPTRSSTGFAHGAPGIAHALLRLFEATGDAVYRDAARDAFAFEPYAPMATKSAMDWSWCHGITGAGLARLRELDVCDVPESRAEVEAVLVAAESATVRGIDHLCCGTLSRTELLLSAARRLDRPTLGTGARAIAAGVVDAATRRRTYHLTAGQTYAPMLFQGTAGIGYQLLRLEDPATFPSPLLWE